jgi:hypothetical protein
MLVVKPAITTGSTGEYLEAVAEPTAAAVHKDPNSLTPGSGK